MKGAAVTRPVGGDEMLFRDRVEAGDRLGERLAHLRPASPVVVGLPRGGVPVASEVAQALEAPLDVIVVRKLGVPFQPELGMGAIGEGGIRVVNDDMVRLGRVSRAELAAVEARERAELDRRVRRFRGDHPRIPLAGRTVVVVDDGVATGSTARAACLVARAQGAARVVLAVPVAPSGWEERIGAAADELVCLATPEPFWSIGQWYQEFTQTTDQEVVACLARASRRTPATVVGGSAADDPPDAVIDLTDTAVDQPVRPGPVDGPDPGDPIDDASARARGCDEDVVVPVGPVVLGGRLTVPPHAVGIVLFVHGSGSSRLSPRNRYVAHVLNRAGLATLLFDLLTPTEEMDRANVFDVDLLAGRLLAVTRWLRRQPEARGLRMAFFGASTGAAAALWAAAELGDEIAAVVSRGGRPDLAAARLADVTAPTLLVVGGHDDVVLELNRRAGARLGGPHELVVVRGATHLFEEPGTLQTAAGHARRWFTEHLTPAAALSARG
jgi:putative phosphoribosyl transferase